MTLEKILAIRLGTTVTYLVPGKNGYLLIDAGNAFGGDIAVNLLLFGKRRYESPFGDSPHEMTASLQNLVRKGAKRIYPSHGQLFDAYRLCLE